MKAVLIIAHSWPPDAFVGAVRPVHLAKQLARHGWKPVVVTVKEHYYECRNDGGVSGASAAIVLRTRCLPNPRAMYIWLKVALLAVFGRRKDFQASVQRWTPDAGKSTGSPSFVARAKRLLLSLLYTPDEFLGWLPFAIVRSFRAVGAHRIRCVISTGPPFTGHLVGLAVKKLCGISWVADFRDPWSWNEGLPLQLRSALSDRINRWLENLVMCHADQVVCVTPATTDRYRKMYPSLPGEKWITITNGYDAEEFFHLGPITPAPRFTISYAGSFDFERTPNMLLQALGQLLMEGAIDRDRVTLRFLGQCQYTRGRPVEEMIEEYGLKGVAEIAGYLPRPEALREMKRAHVLVLLAGVQKLTVAAKAYEYIGAGRPILAVTEEGATAELIRRVGGGVVVAPADLARLKGALYAWYREYKRNPSGKQDSPIREPEIAKEYEWSELGARYALVLWNADATLKERSRELSGRDGSQRRQMPWTEE